jgi:hypothetical protein
VSMAYSSTVVNAAGQPAMPGQAGSPFPSARACPHPAPCRLK